MQPSGKFTAHKQKTRNLSEQNDRVNERTSHHHCRHRNPKEMNTTETKRQTIEIKETLKQQLY